MNNLKILEAAIIQCDVHMARMEMALKHISKLIPFTSEKLAHLADEDLGFLELLTSRLAKLQDTIGQKIFPNMLILLEEDISGKSFIDILNKLEKLGFLESAEKWKQIREIRNAIAHDYPDNPDLVATNLNQAINIAYELLNYWQRLKRIIQQQILKNQVL
jgi:hypothetical protein